MEEKDQTLINEKKKDTYHKRSIIKEHITIISELECNYFGDVSVAQGTSKCISKAIWDFFENKECSTNSIRAIGCDGAAVNCGTNGVIMRLLEIYIGKPLH